MSYSDWYDRLTEFRAEVSGELHELKDIQEAKPHDENLAERISWIEEMLYHNDMMIDALNGVIGVS